MLNNSWNKIVDLFNEYKNNSEENLQLLWESIFSDSGLFGYSRMNNDIDSRRSIQIGSSERIVPDIIIKKDNKDAFIVELKQSYLSCGHKQLFSYLKLLQMNIGVLICDRIIVYSFENGKNDEEQPKVEINFSYDNPLGLKFIELFKKDNFNASDITKFIKNNELSSNNIAEIKKVLSNEELVKGILKDYFLKTYTEQEYLSAIKDMNIGIQMSKNLTPQIQNTTYQVKKNIIPTNKKVDKFYFMRLLKLKFKTFTFASKNSVTNCYWANPNIGMLNNTWDLVLNDNIRCKWYYFQIPANSIKLNQLVLRSDKKYLIDLQIRYNDSSFVDTRSGISFAKWLKKQGQY